MDIFMSGFALFGLILFCWFLYEAFIVPHLLKKAKIEAERLAKVQQDAEALEKRIKESRERAASFVAPQHKQKKVAKPLTPADVRAAVQPKSGGNVTRTSRERDEEEVYTDNAAIALAVIMATEPEPSYVPEPVQTATYDDRSFTSYSAPEPVYESKRESSWTSYDSGSSSSYDSDSSSSSSSSSDW